MRAVVGEVVWKVLVWAKVSVGKSMVWAMVWCGQWYGVDGVGSITAMDEGGGGPARAWESHSSTCSRDP